MPKLRMVAMVETTALAIPAWARAKAVKGLTGDAGRIWLGRIAANLLARLDREAGGSPRLTMTAYRQCKVCGRALLGVAAEHRLELDRRFEGERIPCSPDCVEVQAARQKRKGRPRNARIE